MYKTIIIQISFFITICANLLFSNQIETAYNYNINDSKALISETRIDFEYLGSETISQENSLYIYLNNTNDGTIV